MVDQAAPAWTVERAGRDAYGRPWAQVRKAGGQQVRVEVLDVFATPDDVLLAIEAAVRSLPDPPGRWAI